MVVMKANPSQKDALKAGYSADRKAASWARCLAWRMAKKKVGMMWMDAMTMSLNSLEKARLMAEKRVDSTAG